MLGVELFEFLRQRMMGQKKCMYLHFKVIRGKDTPDSQSTPLSSHISAQLMQRTSGRILRGDYKGSNDACLGWHAEPRSARCKAIFIGY